MFNYRYSFAARYSTLTVISGLCAFLGFYLVVRANRRMRLNPTRCNSCGYDLRGGHDKCPECGAESHVPAGVVVK